MSEHSSVAHQLLMCSPYLICVTSRIDSIIAGLSQYAVSRKIVDRGIEGNLRLVEERAVARDVVQCGQTRCDDSL